MMNSERGSGAGRAGGSLGLKNYQMYNDKIGGKNLHDKYSID